MTHPYTLLETAKQAALAGGDHAMTQRHRRTEVLESHAHDVKLVLDVECQQVVESCIRANFPEHAFLGEEDGTMVNGQRLRKANNSSETMGLQWIIDPIDGTVNFANGLPVWCCSVAVQQEGKTLAAAVYAPMLEALYAASIDTPATCNGSRIHVSERTNIKEAVIMTGMDKDLKPGIPPLACFSSIVTSCRKARIAGSAAVDLCWVAQGAADGYFEGSIYLWDIAAAGLIVQQAGGMSEILEYKPTTHQVSFIASNGHIHKAFKAILPVTTSR